ncbi:hypothetical protein BC826DRAFT_1079601 [Russula brevipes]|nr:hypothetical protein BC826DRAFT_1079601 [Russula brevipes]
MVGELFGWVLSYLRALPYFPWVSTALSVECRPLGYFSCSASWHPETVALHVLDELSSLQANVRYQLVFSFLLQTSAARQRAVVWNL